MSSGLDRGGVRLDAGALDLARLGLLGQGTIRLEALGSPCLGVLIFVSMAVA
jgi:hypothetical protein